MTTGVERQPETSTQTDGLVLHGSFLSAKVQEGKPDDKGGKWPDRYIVTILSGDRTIQVEYRDEATAKEAGAIKEPMARVKLPVGVRAAKGFVFYFGRTRS